MRQNVLTVVLADGGFDGVRADGERVGPALWGGVSAGDDPTGGAPRPEADDERVGLAVGRDARSEDDAARTGVDLPSAVRAGGCDKHGPTGRGNGLTFPVSACGGRVRSRETGTT